MTASQRACQTTNIVLVDAPLTHRARLTATRLLMNVKTGVHAFRTVLKGVINVQVDFVAAKIPTRIRTSLNARESQDILSLPLEALTFPQKRKCLKASIQRV